MFEYIIIAHSFNINPINLDNLQIIGEELIKMQKLKNNIISKLK